MPDRSGLPDVVVILIEIPKPQRPVAHAIAVGYQRPVFVFDLRPYFGGDARGAEWALVPAIGCPQAVLLLRPLMRGSELGSARLKRPFCDLG